MTPLELDADTAAAANAGAPKPPPAVPPLERKGWTAPETVFHLHGYLRMRGTVDVMGLISASLEMRLEMEYDSSTNKCTGRASVRRSVPWLSRSTSVGSSRSIW